MIKDRPPRLDRIVVDSPLFFVTFCTRNRAAIPSLDVAQRTMEDYGRRAMSDFNIALGRYVIMPDHVHLFVQGGPDFDLSKWVGGLKRALSVSLAQSAKSPLWQPGFFDHILRSEESYAQKWEYVRDNPVRAGLVAAAADWKYAGEIVRIDRA